MKMRISILLAMFMILISIGSGFADSDIQGSLMIVGGALRADNDAVYERFIELAGGAENAKIGIIPAASGSPYKYSKCLLKT